VPADQDVISGSEPLAGGMHIAVRLRRDFTVSNVARLLAAYLALDPAATPTMQPRP
jgi:hypothetical protein